MSGLRSQLQAIHDRHGELTPELVVETARPKDHPLHKRIFDRSPKEAAESWYLQRAEDLIREVTVRRVLANGRSVELRAFSPVRVGQPGVYDPLDDIVQDDIASATLLRMMEREWKSMRARYNSFAAFWDMVRKDTA